ETAAKACELIEVEYAPLDSVAGIEDALNGDDPAIHEYGDAHNVHKAIALEFGDVESGLAGADLVQEDLFFYEGNTHLPMEQHAALADYRPDDRLTLWSSSQTPHYVHRALATVLEMVPSRIRVIATPNGGGFGGKSDPFNHEIVVAELSRRTGRPVKICLTREEVFYCHRGRHPTLMWIKTGFKHDGSITGMHFRSFLDGGAYGSYGVASTYYTGALQTVTYPVAAYKFEGLREFTNKAPCGPNRGHGTPQPRFALEVHIDKAAEKLGLDPARMRLDHLVEPDSVTANYLKIGSMGLGACIEKVVAESGWNDRRGKLPEGKGLGLACGSYISGAGLPIYWNNMPHSGVQLKLDRGGGVTVFCGSTEIGQGSDSVLAYVVAEVLGINPFEIDIVTADTSLTPVDLGSYSSRVTLMTGNAALQAAERARELLVRSVAEKWDVPGVRVAMADGQVFDVQDPIDIDTGETQVEDVWIAHDIGQAINPVVAIGQVEGSVYMGLGEALMEEMTYRGNRNIVHHHPSMLEYKSPTTHEMCRVHTYLIEDPDPNGPVGAKEVGQGPLLPIPPAIVNGVYDAVG
ncbi:MAG: molybdopterin-dependent oxidoreductase, partial [Gemmatimonadota bacterium]